MADQAKVTSLDALESFRASLIVFMTTAHRCVDEGGDEVRRTRMWLQGEQRMHWEGECRKRKRVLDQAEADLYSARLSGLKDRTQVQENAVRKAKAAMAEAEEKLVRVKKWNRDFDDDADPLVKRLEGMRYFLDHDMPKALTYLVQAHRTLESYAETSTPRSTPAAE